MSVTFPAPSGVDIGLSFYQGVTINRGNAMAISTDRTMTTHRPPTEVARDRLTWTAYVMLAWFAYLQAAPGLVIVHLRDELDLSYSTGGLHVAAFAAGSMVAGVISVRLEQALGRRALLWLAAALMGVGAIGLTAGRAAEVTIGSVVVMGASGGL